ncbi:MAG TPA: hypothetical protein VFZ69_03185 [Longimicrobiales bacterium]
MASGPPRIQIPNGLRWNDDHGGDHDADGGCLEGLSVLRARECVISDITPTSARFEQAFSNDGGRSWELNWIAVDTKIDGASSR